MTNLYSILRKPIITEKTSKLLKIKKVAFEVSKKTNKYQIREAFKALFGTKSIKIHIMITCGKSKRMGKTFGKRKNIKKAIITVGKEFNPNELMLKE
jgi:large subunit ribosomal protein L23